MTLGRMVEMVMEMDSDMQERVATITDNSGQGYFLGLKNCTLCIYPKEETIPLWKKRGMQTKLSWEEFVYEIWEARSEKKKHIFGIISEEMFRVDSISFMYTFGE